MLSEFGILFHYRGRRSFYTFRRAYYVTLLIGITMQRSYTMTMFFQRFLVPSWRRSTRQPTFKTSKNISMSQR